jgi:hypothetical protein
MFMRTKGKDKSQGVAVPDSEAMKTFNDTMNMIQDTRINQSQVREHMTSLLQVTGYHYQHELDSELKRHLYFE